MDRNIQGGIERIRENSHSFEDIEQILILLFRQYLSQPSQKVSNIIGYFVTKYVPFRKQPLSEGFKKEIASLTDTAIGRGNYDLFHTYSIHIEAFFANTLAHEETVKFLEKAIPFFEKTDEYPRTLERMKCVLSSLKGMEELEDMLRRGVFGRRERNAKDEYVENRFDQMNDMLLDMCQTVKKISLDEYRKSGTEDIIEK